jgi:hypothetical protein
MARRGVRRTLNLNLLSAVAVSRFALIAGEGARVPSTVSDENERPENLRARLRASRE